ncbi:DUF1294 domain-containing protein [Vibrio diazotrophicus]
MMKGQIIEWNDSKGYGFISALNGELKVFFHISSVKTSHQRPKLNDKVFFEVDEDDKGRFNAANVVIEGAYGFPVTVLFGFTYLVAVFASVFLLGGEWYLIPIYISLSLVTYLMYAWDKKAAQEGAWRTPEKTLHLLSLAGGWPGALLAQFHLRHKSKKQPFKTILWMTVFLNIGGYVWLFTETGREILKQISSI